MSTDLHALAERLRTSGRTWVHPDDGRTLADMDTAADIVERYARLVEDFDALGTLYESAKAEEERLRETLAMIAEATTIADAVPDVRRVAREALADRAPHRPDRCPTCGSDDPAVRKSMARSAAPEAGFYVHACKDTWHASAQIGGDGARQ